MILWGREKVTKKLENYILVGSRKTVSCCCWLLLLLCCCCCSFFGGGEFNKIKRVQTKSKTTTKTFLLLSQNANSESYKIGLKVAKRIRLTRQNEAMSVSPKTFLSSLAGLHGYMIHLLHCCSTVSNKRLLLLLLLLML